MTAREVVKRILVLGGYFARQVGSHARYSAKYSDAAGDEATCHTTVPMHTGDIPKGTLGSIEKAMEPAFGKGWAMNDMYRAKVTWDGDQWLADVVDLPGAHTYAKTVPSLRKRLREVVVLMDDRPDSDLNDPTAFDVSLDYSLVATEVVQARQARDEYEQLAAKLAQQAADRTREAILWARDQGISLRDTAELLDLSHQRINQIEKEIPTVRSGTLEKVVRTKGKDGVVRSRRGRGNGTTQTIDSVRTQRTQ